MVQQARRKLVPLRAQAQRAMRVGKNRFAVGIGQAQMEMQPAAGACASGLGMQLNTMP